ncbi:MAG: class I SAM-dependent methyltransferase [Candidatus Omnitrophota bacterium]|nr:class I SAM-dependent methyltransferase [Candidatus Omnitrophota bacterium]
MHKKLSPEKILEMNWGYAKTSVLASAVELDIFTHIASGKRTVDQISKAAKSSRRGIEMLLNALVGLDLLVKNKVGIFRLSPESAEFLVRGKARYLGDMSLHSLQLNKTWFYLGQSVRSGKPYNAVEQEDAAEDYFPRLVRGLFQMNYPCAKYAAAYLKGKHQKISDILDVAVGSGVWSIAIAEEFKAARITALDFPEILKITGEYINKHNFSSRYKYIQGDLRQVDFGSQRYDLVILGHICHSEGKIYTQQLFKKSFGALKKGGALLVAEFLLNNDKTGPLMPLFFALNMLLNTSEGDVFKTVELRHWLAGAGFAKIEVLDRAPSVSPLMLAFKK